MRLVNGDFNGLERCLTYFRVRWKKQPQAVAEYSQRTATIADCRNLTNQLWGRLAQNSIAHTKNLKLLVNPGLVAMTRPNLLVTV